ncbi:MAG TPA: hypothetical protein VJK05_04190 [archaeon]|nr:hypothetical protein [archaeon]
MAQQVSNVHKYSMVSVRDSKLKIENLVKRKGISMKGYSLSDLDKFTLVSLGFSNQEVKEILEAAEIIKEGSKN